MRIPNNDQSFVADQKITQYLLNDTHETGKHKAAFFSCFGFELSNVDLFRDALIKHSIERDIQNITQTNFGNKYILRCEIETPDSRNPCIVTVWIIENKESVPKFVTAYPA